MESTENGLVNWNEFYESRREIHEAEQLPVEDLSHKLGSTEAEIIAQADRSARLMSTGHVEAALEAAEKVYAGIELLSDLHPNRLASLFGSEAMLLRIIDPEVEI